MINNNLNIDYVPISVVHKMKSEDNIYEDSPDFSSENDEAYSDSEINQGWINDINTVVPFDHDDVDAIVGLAPKEHLWIHLQPHLWSIVYESKQGPALVSDSHDTDGVLPDVAHSSNLYHKRVFNHKNVYHGVGYALANSTLIVGSNSCVLIDTLGNVAAAKELHDDFSRFVDFKTKPITIVIYTHHHLDHIGGVKGFINEEDVKNGLVKIYAHKLFHHSTHCSACVIAPILGYRSLYSFGALLPINGRNTVNTGVGANVVQGEVSFIPLVKLSTKSIS